MSTPTKFYDQLTVDERFRLFVAAAARRDEQELDRLNATCPRFRYRMEDAEYSRRKTRFFLLALAFQGELQRLDLAIAAFLMLIAAFEEIDDPNGGGNAMDHLRTLARRRKVKETAWRTFCDGIGVAADQPAAALGFNTDSAEDPILGSLAELIGEIELDEDAVTREAEFLSRLFGD